RHLPRDLKFPRPVDDGLAQHGRVLFDKACARCHGTYEDDGRVKTYVEKIIPIDYVDTDPARALAVTAGFAAEDVRLRAAGLDQHLGRCPVGPRRSMADAPDDGHEACAT